MSELLTKWSVNESLLQSHRSIFICSQTFLIAVGAILLETSKPEWLIWLLAGSGFTIIWLFWFRVVITRARVVDYYKFQLDDNFKANFDNCSEDDYVRNRDGKRKSINKTIDKSNLRATRWKMDVGLPIIFSLIWLALLIVRNCLA
jgi:hypothetical protein